ncbi:XisI protein [Microcoleus sp. FACHB-672]|uniref:XisI protein n=1 Tax=Microcoleus sp. FACHB-672 TaxID=2692825 RepID=UPI0016876E15|nr:XisI protein [Microcoleus sp. FACHB-672]MBD2039084.1 XisI protein [Microcoleus sp. FACHB-672]
MNRIKEYRELINKILLAHANIPYSHGDIKSIVIVSQDSNHFLIMNEGWDGKRRIHGCLVHAEIRDGKIWIHYDGIEDGITDELVAGGVPKDHIVLAFHPPYIREHTGYAIK